ncbi:hypothetical protein [Chryseobacterium terrae]|uniref:Uncharacterized protein n=1 Tax=Chryseobacterium terrae TaxID=3163299 RepID=A0ABW8Y1E0_9FLAO
MKKGILSVAIFLCAFTFAQTGSDRDSHGCIGSAGYTYSKIKKNCVRVFEQEIKINQLNPKNSSSSMAAIIFSENKRKAEVLLPGENIILRKKCRKDIWKKGKYILTPTETGYKLEKDKITIYQ